MAERERDRQRIEQHYDELLDAERRALDYQEFIAWTLDEFGARMPEAWKTRARAALACRGGGEMSGYELIRVKRGWVPDWLWRGFCVGNLATFTPWREILTRTAGEEEGK